MQTQHKAVDVVIIGAGPSGASAALSLLNHSQLSVAIVEHSDLNGVRVGEHVTASIFDLVNYLNIAPSEFESGSFLSSFDSTSYWGSNLPSNRNSMFSAQSETYQVDREKFDLKLIQQVSDRGGMIYPRTKCTHYGQDKSNHWTLSLSHPEQGEFNLQTKFLIDASGLSASVCRKIGYESQKVDQLAAAGCFFQLNDNHQNTREQVIETTPLGWWYKAYLPNQMMVVSFFSDADIISNQRLNTLDVWRQQLQQTSHIKRSLGNAQLLAKKPWVRNSYSQVAGSHEYNNFLATGDAVSSFDPISSMGIGFAISSACHAANVVIAQFSDQSDEEKEQQIQNYYRDIKNNFNQYLTLRKTYYQKETRWPDSEFWQRRCV